MLLALAVAVSISAAPVASEGAALEPGPFTGEAFRFPSKPLVPRLLSDFAAIPLGVPRWSAGEWAWFGATAALTVGMFFPLDAPLDQRFQDWLQRTAPALRLDLWSPRNDVFIFGGMAVVGLGALGYGLAFGARDFHETGSLMIEALVVWQAFHISQKLLLSRDGPDSGDGRTIKGPTAETFERFPEGAPSGHAGTLFALATVAALYWEQPWLTVVSYAVATIFSAYLVIDRYHYLSDVLWGASMGAAVGRFVVLHRSSRFEYVDGQPRRKSTPELTPTVVVTSRDVAPGAVLRGEF